MSKEDGIRALILYVPLVAVLILKLTRRRHPRRFAACLISALWCLPSLLVLQRWNQMEGWWTFAGGSVELRGMPLELYFAWVTLWGILPMLASTRLRIAWAAALLMAFDLVAMPFCSAVVRLGPHWLYGEATALVVVLLPALCLAKWTIDDAHVCRRAALQVVISAMLFLFLIPELAFALRPGQGWEPLLELPGWALQLVLQGMVVLALPGLGAVMEFAGRGDGTPIPYDAPKRLVTSGIYRYCANPMQLSCAIAMFAWAAILRNWWIGAAAFISVIYSAGIAEWDEGEDLSRRFGAGWTAYRNAVSCWRFQFRPFHAGADAELCIGSACQPCSELHKWLASRNPLGLTMIDADTLLRGSITRLRYDPRDGTPPEEGIRALARALEHIHFGWVLAGVALRLPVIWRTVQLVMDASGFEPRKSHQARDHRFPGMSAGRSEASTLAANSSCRPNSQSRSESRLR